MLFDILAGMGELIVKGTIAVGKITIETTALLGEVLVDTFSQDSSNSTSTYEYWSKLSYQEQEEYFKSNEYLRDYIKNDYYPNDRHLTAKYVQHIADSLNKEFTNKYNRY